MTKLISNIIIAFILIICGCGADTNISSQSSDTDLPVQTGKGKGDIAFSLKWETPSSKSDDPFTGWVPRNPQSEIPFYAPQIDCTAIGVSTVSANVYDSGGTYITSGGPWNCADHSGTITGISAGINRMITVNGKDSSGRIIYNGQITGVTINKDQTIDAGQITMTYVANDTTAPTDGSLSAGAGSSQVSLSWSGFSDSGSGIGSYKLVYSTTSTPSSCSSGTQIFTGTSTSYTHTGLNNSTTYYYRICATDKAGNTSNGATTSATPQTSGTTTTTTTTAPPAPTGVTATAGSSQVSISWSSVSGATSYNIYWSTTSGVTKTTGTKLTGVTSPYTHTGLTNGMTYYYVVASVNSYGESSESSQVSATPISTSGYQFVTKWGSLGSGDGQFNSPFGVAVDSSGNVYVADINNHRIQKFNSSGTFITKWGSSGSGDGQFDSPMGVAVDSSGNIYVCEQNHRIQKFNSSGTFITKWGSSGTGDGQFNGPRGIAVDSSGNVYVADINNHRIQKFNSGGTFITKWGSNGSGDSQFYYTTGVAVDSSGGVYVVDSYNHRIQKFNSSGTFITKWGSNGSGDGQFY